MFGPLLLMVVFPFAFTCFFVISAVKDFRKTKRKGKLFAIIPLTILVFIVYTFIYTALFGGGCGFSSRCKSTDAGTRANLVYIREMANILYTENTPNSFAGLCTDTKVNSFLQSAKKTSKSKVVNRNIAEGGSDSAVTCHVSNSNDSWAVEVPLRNNAEYKSWCADSSGASKSNGGIYLAPFASKCP